MFVLLVGIQTETQNHNTDKKNAASKGLLTFSLILFCVVGCGLIAGKKKKINKHRPLKPAGSSLKAELPHMYQ